MGNESKLRFPISSSSIRKLMKFPNYIVDLA
jgi:hypothetical protein